MKQKIWLATILCIVMIFTLAGCGSDSGNYESVSTDSINSGMTIGNGISNNSKSEPSYEESYENTDSYIKDRHHPLSYMWACSFPFQTGIYFLNILNIFLISV